MELETRDVIGETSDDRFGMDDPQIARKQGAFEISSLTLSTATGGDDTGDLLRKAIGQKDGNQGSNRRSTSTPGSSKQKEISLDTFTIKKAIDSASPILFRLCCQQKPIDWAVISLREAGEEDNPDTGVKRKPWMILEFHDLHVDKFGWELSPAASGDDIKEQESVDFSFTKVLFKYFGQEKEGTHSAPLIIGWDQASKESDVPDDLKSERW